LVAAPTPAASPEAGKRRTSAGRVAATPGRRERNKQEKLRRIKQAARKLFYELGYEATTTQAIAEAADIGSGTLFSYVRVKEDLLLMVFLDDLLEVIEKSLKSIPARTKLVDRVFRLFDALLRFHVRDAQLSRDFTRETYAVRSPERRADIGRLMAAILQPIEQMVAYEQTHGRIRTDVDPSMTAWQFFAFYYGVVSGLVNSMSTPAQGRALLRKSLDGLVRGLRP
jgi:AcrR family transcriptional regulator